MASQQNPNRVAGGLKATVNNPNISEEAKANATQRLQSMGSETESGTKKKAPKTNLGGLDDDDDDADFEDEIGNDGTSSLSTSGGGGETNRVLGGYKATLKNPNVSDEAKSHAEQVLKDSDAM